MERGVMLACALSYTGGTFVKLRQVATLEIYFAGGLG